MLFFRKQKASAKKHLLFWLYGGRE